MQNNYDNHYADGKAEYAGFWVRFAAYLIDSIVVFAGLFIVRLIMAGVMAAVKGTVLGGNILFQYNLKDIVLYVFKVLYFILFTYYTGTTLGKKAMNLRVVRADGEEKLSLVTVLYRETVGRFLSSVIINAGYLMIGIDKEKRGLHDILCDTRVIYAKKVKVFKTEVVVTPFAEPIGNSPKMPWDAPYTGNGGQMSDRESVKWQQNGNGYHSVQPQSGFTEEMEKKENTTSPQNEGE